MANLKKITWAEASEKYNLTFLPSYVPSIYNANDMIYVFEEDAHFEDLEVDEFFNPSEFIGVIFCKNLSATNNIIQQELDFGPLFIVLGNVTAQNVYVSGGMVYFRGAVTVNKTLVCGVYNHGETSIDGEISAEVIISYDHMFNHSTYKDGEFHDNIIKGLLVHKENLNELAPLLIDEAIVEEDEDYFYIDGALLLSSVRENKSLLKR
jgi:hypothetical protein